MRRCLMKQKMLYVMLIISLLLAACSTTAAPAASDATNAPADSSNVIKIGGLYSMTGGDAG